MINSPEFQALRREYIHGAIERMAYLSGEAALMRAGQKIDLVRLRQEIHKFRGSGGFYGFAALSATSGLAEDLLVAVIGGGAELDGPAVATLVDKVVAAVKAAAAELKMATQ